ncbi:non-ribosomal peptide synthetase [Kitasatospora camelliae]|uniref:Non-ribosomal peptide synthetase n=1 Tax=Kitasatospora camelliae TaxID=3156397 RepID=A0AAU8JUC1_9ACTN
MPTSITAAYLDRYRSAAAQGGPAELLPLTGAQRRFLLTRRLDPQGRPDVVPLFFAFPRGTVDPGRLRRAAVRLAERHPALRGRFTALRGTPVLRLGAPSVEVATVPVAPGGTAAEALRQALLDWPADGPALRLLVAAEPGAEEEVLALALDHAACDEQSLGIVTDGLGAAYPDDPARPGAPEDGVAAYRDAVERQLAAEAAAASPAAHAHWAARLGGLAGATATAAGRPGPRPTGMLVERLPAATGAARGAVFPALLDAVSAAGYALFGPDRPLALGYPWGGRPAGTAPDVLGCFLNTLVHPAAPGPGDLDGLSAAWWDDLDHADTPFDEVVHAARSGGARWSGALDGLLTFEDLGRRPPLVLDGTEGREIHLAGRPLAAPFAVSASHGSELLVRLAWDRERLRDTAAEAAFQTLLSTLRHHLHPPA